MQKKSLLLLILVFVTLQFLSCATEPTSPDNQSEQRKLNVGNASPTPSPSPSVSPSPSPSPTSSPDPSSVVSFEVFFIAKARVELDRDVGDQRFEVEGQFRLSTLSNGIDVLNEEVVVTFGSFSESVAAGSFLRDDDDQGFEFEGSLPGIKKIEIRDDGEFEVKARDLDLSDFDLTSPVPFSLQIGNDLGESEIQFDSEGRFENPNPAPSPSPSVSPTPSPSASPSPSPSPSVSPSPGIHLRGAIEALVIRGDKNGDVTVQGVKFVVTSTTELEDENGNDITLNDFQVGETVDAWGPPPVNNVTQAERIRKG